jgi:hypothetical protein
VQQTAIRIGDAERDEVARQLREHYAAGRLTSEEFDERLEACLAARTTGDLQRLTEDLPRLGRAPAPKRERAGWVSAWRHWAAVSMIVWTIWAVAALSGDGFAHPWPLWVSGPWAAVLIARMVRGEPTVRPVVGRAELRHGAYRRHHHC